MLRKVISLLIGAVLTTGLMAEDVSVKKEAEKGWFSAPYGSVALSYRNSAYWKTSNEYKNTHGYAATVLTLGTKLWDKVIAKGIFYGYYNLKSEQHSNVYSTRLAGYDEIYLEAPIYSNDLVSFNAFSDIYLPGKKKDGSLSPTTFNLAVENIITPKFETELGTVTVQQYLAAIVDLTTSKKERSSLETPSNVDKKGLALYKHIEIKSDNSATTPTEDPTFRFDEILSVSLNPSAMKDLNVSVGARAIRTFAPKYVADTNENDGVKMAGYPGEWEASYYMTTVSYKVNDSVSVSDHFRHYRSDGFRKSVTGAPSRFHNRVTVTYSF